MGALEDTRPEEVKQYDVKFQEIVASADTVDWSVPYEPVYPPLEQGQAGSCVANSAAKLLGVYYKQKYNDWVNFSPGWIYYFRYNKPNGGMASFDVWNILKEKGQT